MKALRVSATDIDQLRYFRDTDDMELADLIARLKHLMPSSEAMEAGTALHAALEHASDGTVDGFTHDGFTFSFECEADLHLTPIREMKATRVCLVDDVEVTLVGKVDGIVGKSIIDHKFTAQFDADRYMPSFQWKAYLEIFEANEFTWNIFEARESAPKNYLIRNFHKLTMHRYPGMGADVERDIREFVVFARDHLPERFTPVARAA